MRAGAAGGFSCRRCQRALVRSNGILVDSVMPSAVSNLLETIDYDGTHGVSAAASEELGAAYAAFIRPKFLADRVENLTVLEIGSGSGVLSLGLALAFPFRRMVVSDLSAAFMTVNRRRLRQNIAAEGTRERIEFVTCTIDDLPLRTGAVDLIVGNSVLHHIYDYEAALRALRRKLRPGGWVVLSEPVIQGKVPIGLACRLMAELDRVAQPPRFSESERAKLRDMAIMCTRGFWREAAERFRDTADDKHLFDVAEVAALGLRTGFSLAQAVSVMPVEQALAEQMRGTLRMMGIRTEALAAYAHVLDAITEQLLAELPAAFCANHAFLSFRAGD